MTLIVLRFFRNRGTPGTIYFVVLGTLFSLRSFFIRQRPVEKFG